MLRKSTQYAAQRRRRHGSPSASYYPITFPIARLAGLPKCDYSKKGKTLNIADATIAAVSIHYDLPLITDNTRDFPMRQLHLHSLPTSVKGIHHRPDTAETAWSTTSSSSVSHC